MSLSPVGMTRGTECEVYILFYFSYLDTAVDNSMLDLARCKDTLTTKPKKKIYLHLFRALTPIPAYRKKNKKINDYTAEKGNKCVKMYREYPANAKCIYTSFPGPWRKR